MISLLYLCTGMLLLALLSFRIISQLLICNASLNSPSHYALLCLSLIGLIALPCYLYQHLGRWQIIKKMNATQTKKQLIDQAFKNPYSLKKHLQYYLKQQPQDAKAHYLLAKLDMLLGHWQEALNHLLASEKLGSKTPAVKSAKNECLEQLKSEKIQP
jgi:cytochrome c-type biogenesis protein CcmH/NrfG